MRSQDGLRTGRPFHGFCLGLPFGSDEVGAGIALLAAPQAGTRTRRRIRKVAGQLRHSASDHWDDLAEDVKDRVDDAVRGARDRFFDEGQLLKGPPGIPAFSRLPARVPARSES